MKNSHESMPKPKNQLTTKGKVLSAGMLSLKRAESGKDSLGLTPLGKAVVLGFAALGAADVVSTISSGVHHAAHVVSHDRQEDAIFGERNLVDKLSERHINPTDVTVHTITSDEANPKDVAHDMGANNTNLVTDEIVGQLGGDRFMQPGQQVVIPNDQLKQQPQQVQADHK